jgi:3-dehydroquinate dehydratase II
MRNRVEVMHGVNLDQLGRRDPAQYGGLSFDALERRVEAFARELGLTPRFFHSNHEGEFVEHLHRLEGMTDAVLLNPGAWTHYAWAIRDALELTGLPAVEVHLSDVTRREEFRRVSVFDGLASVVGRVVGKGADGYRDALALLKEELA